MTDLIVRDTKNILENKQKMVNPFPADGDFCRLLITLTNRIDPDKPKKTGFKLFDTLRYFFLKMLLEKNLQFDKVCKITELAKS